MNNEPNNPELCLAMAKLLPTRLQVGKSDEQIYWLSNSGHPVQAIRDTEWFYVMQLVEECLKPEETSRYENFLALKVFADDKDEYWADGVKHIQAYCFHATFNQRARAINEVKGVTP